MAKSDDKYTMLGIYDEGEIVMTSRPADVFLPKVVNTFALIRKISGGPRGEGMCGLKYYSTACVDFDYGHITEPETWRKIVDNGLADSIKDREDNALRYVLRSNKPIKREVFNILYEAYPETKLNDILWLCNRIEAAKWALEHGADKDYDGLTEPMQEVMARFTMDRYDGEEIFQFVYGCKSSDYLESLQA